MVVPGECQCKTTKTTEVPAMGLTKAQDQEALMKKPSSCSHNPVYIGGFWGGGGWLWSQSDGIHRFQLCDHKMTKKILAKLVTELTQAFHHKACGKNTETTWRT